MKTFFACLDAKYPREQASPQAASPSPPAGARQPAVRSVEDVECEEELLAAFGGK
jgi:hypothetical protein